MPTQSDQFETSFQKTAHPDVERDPAKIANDALCQAFFKRSEKNSRRKNPKLKAKAQKGTFFKLSDIFE